MTLRFTVARLAAAHLDPAIVRAKARSRGVEPVGYQFLELDSQPTVRQISCSPEIAEIIAESFIDIAEGVVDRDVRLASARAAVAATNATVRALAGQTV